MPLLHRWAVDVVTLGPSLEGDDSYYLIRAYATLEDLETSEAAFYGSVEWRRGPRQAILDCIDTYTTIVIEIDAATIEDLRRR